MNRKKIHKIIVKLITGICLIVYFTTSGIIGFNTVKAEAVSPNAKYTVEYKVKSSSSMLTGKIGGQYTIHPWYQNRLNNLARDYGKKINIYSGYRSVELQRQLFNNSDRSGKMVAPPGKSRHNVGLAVDCDGWATELNNTQLAKYGLYKPMSWENWHIEPIETKNKSTEQLMAKYGTPNEIIVNKPSEEVSIRSIVKMLVDKEIDRIDKLMLNRE